MDIIQQNDKKSIIFYGIDHLKLSSTIQYFELKSYERYLSQFCKNKRGKKSVHIQESKSNLPGLKEKTEFQEIRFGIIHAFSPEDQFFIELQRLFPETEFKISKIEIAELTYDESEKLELLERSCKNDFVKYSKSGRDSKNRKESFMQFVENAGRIHYSNNQCKKRVSYHDRKHGFFNNEWRLFGNFYIKKVMGINGIRDLIGYDFKKFHNEFSENYIVKVKSVDYKAIGRIISGKKKYKYNEALGKLFIMDNEFNPDDMGRIVSFLTEYKNNLKVNHRIAGRKGHKPMFCHIEEKVLSGNKTIRHEYGTLKGRYKNRFIPFKDTPSFIRKFHDSLGKRWIENKIPLWDKE